MSDIDQWAKRVDNTENMPLNDTESKSDSESKFEESTANIDIAWACYVPCWTFNVPVYIHYTLPVYWIVSSLFGLPNLSRFVFYLVANGPILFGTVFFVRPLFLSFSTHQLNNKNKPIQHEFGHAAATLLSKGTVSHILLWPLGGLAYIAHQAGHCADILISLAGPLTHVPMFLIWMLLNKSAEPKSEGIKWSFYVDEDDSYFKFLWGNICTMAMGTNLALFVFNLFLPAYPLDGGRILANILVMKGLDPNAAAKICCYITWVVSFVLLGFGIYGYIEKFAAGVMCILVPIWISYKAYQLWKMAKANEAGKHPLFLTTGNK